MPPLNQENTLQALHNVPAGKIFAAAFITQIAMGMQALFRFNSASPIKAEFFDSIDPLTSGAHIGQILGATFFGFALANFLVAPFVDAIGMRRVHVLALLVSLIGTILLCVAQPQTPMAYGLLFVGALLQGIAWGSIEATMNTLIVSIYPTKKVAKLNLFLAAYGVGMLVAAPLCVLVEKLALGWRLQQALAFIPMIFVLVMVAKLRYPPSERVVNGISFRRMITSTLTQPLFFFGMALVALTAATENILASWLDLTLTKVVGIQGYWLVAFIYTIHVVAKCFAGVLDRRIGSSGILTMASALAMIGLLLLANANSPASAIFAALIFGVGTAYVWPTSLAAVSERFPAGGSFAIGLTATAGMVSTYTLMPVFGKLFDTAKIAAAGGDEAFKALTGPALDGTMVAAAASVFETAAWMPAVTMLAYGALWIAQSKVFRKSGTTRLGKKQPESKRVVA